MNEDTEKRGLLWKPMGEREEFVDKAKNRYEFIDYWPSNKQVKDLHIIRAWKKHERYANQLEFAYIPVTDIAKDELSRLGIFDSLTDEMKKSLDLVFERDRAELAERMENARKSRLNNSDYASLPETMHCTKCFDVHRVVPGQLLKRAAGKGVTPEEFIKGYVCIKCDPTQRGRKASAKWAGFAKELHCHFDGCKVVAKQHPSMTEKQAEGAGKTYQEFVDTWLCREHRPKKAHWLSKEARAARGEVKKDKVEKVTNTTTTPKPRGRKPNPAFIGFPKEATCKTCGKVVKIVPQNIIDKAKLLKKTTEEVISNYKCRSCGGKLTKKMVEEMNKAE